MNANMAKVQRRRTIAYFKTSNPWAEDEEEEDGEDGVEHEGTDTADERSDTSSITSGGEDGLQRAASKESLGKGDTQSEDRDTDRDRGPLDAPGSPTTTTKASAAPTTSDSTEMPSHQQQQPQQHPQQQQQQVHKRSLSKLKSLSKARMALARRRSEEVSLGPRQFLIDVESTLETILRQEDTDGDKKITIMDNGPKVVTLGTLRSEGFIRADVRGTYVLSTLLQELTLAKEMGLKRIVLSETVLNENPVDRLTRMIKTLFWKSLTRSVDLQGLAAISADPKAYSKVPRIYVSHDDPVALRYFQEIAEKCAGFSFEVCFVCLFVCLSVWVVKLTPSLLRQVISLPEMITPEYVRSINNKPGILSLALRPTPKAASAGCLLDAWEGVPFVVPGGRFNELYGWDSYFISLGLLADDEVDLARDLVDNLVYEITHYGMILNANRSYYLTRSQPPFLADMIFSVYSNLLGSDDEQRLENKAWLAKSLNAVIKEYRNVWMSPPRFVEATGLSRYYDPGIGMPPETEPSHFDAVLTCYAHKHNMELACFRLAYIQQRVKDESLDEYFTHDRAVRESGHDTTYRLDGKCAHLNEVELNSMLHKYEVVIGTLIRDEFRDSFLGETSSSWFDAAARRAELLTKYCWNEEKGLFFDYDFVKQSQSEYASVTTIFPIWAGCASEAQIQRIMSRFPFLGSLPRDLTCFSLSLETTSCPSLSSGGVWSRDWSPLEG